MTRSRKLAVGFTVVLAAASLLACTKNNKSSNPYAPAPAGELSGSLTATGAQYAHTFGTAGTYLYYCTVHPACTSLQGSVVVVSAATAIQHSSLAVTIDGGSAGPYGSTCSALSVPLDSVHVGEQVVWTNNSSLPHSVTSR